MIDFEQEDVAEERPSYSLHPVRGVVWGAFWGTPVAAGIVMAINYWRIGRKQAARNAAVLGVLTTAAFFAIVLAIPEDTLDRIPDAVFYVPLLVLVYGVAKNSQGDLVEDHIADGGPVASAWPAVGIGLLCLPIVFGAVFGVAFLLQPSFGTVVEFGDSEVYYAGEATEDDARKLESVLNEAGLFASGPASVRISASAGRYTVSFVIVENAWRDRQVIEAFRDIGEAVAASGFPAPLEVRLCDDYFSVKKTILIESTDDAEDEAP